MPYEAARRSDRLEPVLATKLRTTYRLLEDNLRPEERDRAHAAYCLGWFDHLETERFERADFEQFRQFVDEMAERALKRAQRTGALFEPAFSASGLDLVADSVLRARALAESVRESLKLQ